MTADAIDRKTEAFEVLVTAVRSLSDRGRAPTASEVRLKMRELTYGGFTPQSVGYKRFREFLYEAQAEGRVSVNDLRDGDVSVQLSEANEFQANNVRPIRADLWRAFIDWKANLVRWYDLDSDKAVIVPQVPAPLEPERYAKLRERVDANPSRFIAIEPVPMTTQLEWMREFANSRTDSTLTEVLNAALDGSKPSKFFVSLLRETPVELSKWHVELTKRVRQEVEKWRTTTPELSSIDIDRSPTVEDRDVSKVRDGRQSEKSTHDLSSVLVSAARASSILNEKVGSFAIHLGSRFVDGRPQVNESLVDLRRMLHMAIDRMPAEELRKIQIPVGYMFDH